MGRGEGAQRGVRVCRALRHGIGWQSRDRAAHRALRRG